jgi:hypothetical protein
MGLRATVISGEMSKRLCDALLQRERQSKDIPDAPNRPHNADDPTAPLSVW